jgi:hypothetical protein
MAYLTHLIERQELAFLRWQRSGYRDLAAHDEWLAWREQAMNLKHQLRSCR